MKVSYSTLIYILCILGFSQLYAQLDMPASEKNINKKINKVTARQYSQQDWEVVFNYDISSISGKTGNAGIVYLSDWIEIWTTQWTGNTIDIWDVTESSISLEYADQQVYGVIGIRGMADDGVNVYAANNTDTIWVLSQGFPMVDTTIIAPFDVRYISYDPAADDGNGGFWIGNWSEDPTLIDRSGNTIRSLSYENLGIGSIYGGVYDYFSLDGPYLWLWGQGDGRGNPQNIVQIDPTTGFPTGVQHDVLTDIEYDQDSSLAGGLFIADDLVEGKLILGGILQGDKDYLFGYDITSSIIITFSPTVYTDAATNILESSATLNATINPNGASTTYYFEFGTTTSYGTTYSFASDLNGSSDVSVDYDVTDLTPNTTYHYRIVASNNGGTSYGDDQVFTTSGSTQLTPTVLTNNATNITSNSAKLNGSINPNGLNTTYTFEYGLTASYGSSYSPGNELTGSTTQNVNTTLTGLLPNTTYHFRIIATNSAGTSYGNDLQFITTESQPLADLYWKTLQLSDFVWESGGTINYELKIINLGAGDAISSKSQLFISDDNVIETSDITAGSQITVPAINSGDSTILNGNFAVPTVSQGIYYLGVIVDVENVISESDETNNNFARNGKIVIGYSDEIQIQNTIAFNNAEQSSSFRMIGLPGNNNIPITDLITGSYNEDWVAYYDNGNTDDYLVSYDGSSNFNLTPGKGLWVLSTGNLSISRNVSTVTLESNFGGTGTYEIVYPIDLHGGWNIIANPFDIGISWSDVQSFNSISESIHSFTGTFSTSSTFEPYKGYYFYNVDDLSNLHIPYSSTQALSKKTIVSKNDESKIGLSLLNQENTVSKIYVGLSEKAKTGYDKLDRFMPPGDFEAIRCFIINEELETPYKYLKQDFREIENNHKYRIQVKNSLSEPIKISIDEFGQLIDKEIYLVDNNLVFNNLREEKVISLSSPKEQYEIYVLIGDAEFINSEKILMIPKSFTLFQNYPNPFNPETIISFSLPQDEFVTLAVYDLLGRELEYLVKEEKSAGRYEVKFDAQNYASGIYVYSFNAGKFNETRKMILMK